MSIEKLFMTLKNTKIFLYQKERKKLNKSLNELKKSLKFKKICSKIDSVDYEDLHIYNYNYNFADDDEYRKVWSIRTLFKEFNRDYYKPIRTDGGFAGRNNNYINNMSKGGRYENLSPKEYLNMIRPYLRDLINKHKPIAELNNYNRAEWKIQLTMQNRCISNRRFEETRTRYIKSEALEILLVVTQMMLLIDFLIRFHKDFKVHKKHQIREEVNLSLIVLNYYIIIFKE